MIYVDSNVILDTFGNDPVWQPWSHAMFRDKSLDGPLVTGWIVAAEVGHYLASARHLEHSLQQLAIELVDADFEAAWAASQAYREYRSRGGERSSLLPDFLIGGHAQALGATVLTRDPRRFRSYFPELPLITPENSHD
jgi:predicted nucleic acid-binding protein